jgi:hypothetical protein
MLLFGVSDDFFKRAWVRRLAGKDRTRYTTAGGRRGRGALLGAGGHWPNLGARPLLVKLLF